MNEAAQVPNPCEGMHKPEVGPGCAIPGIPDPAAGLSDIARARREQILEAAETIVAGHGIQDLSLKRIEDLAGMSRGQLTYYFPTKESILLALHDRMMRRMIRERLAGDGPKPLTGRAWDVTQYALGKHLEPGWPPPEARDLLSLMLTFLSQAGHHDEYRKRMSQWHSDWRSMIAADVAGSVPEPRAAPPRVSAALIQALVIGLDVQLLIDPNAFDRAEMLALCTKLLAPMFQPTRAPASGS